MTIPKNKRRTVTVLDEEYEYSVKFGKYCRSIYIKNLNTNHSFTMEFGNQKTIRPGYIQAVILYERYSKEKLTSFVDYRTLYHKLLEVKPEGVHAYNIVPDECQAMDE